ncbi:hypothetical protein [Streptomyces sp. NPDC056132]|uniref:hypothetical protein n=1 Tax=Streptomyces sp. NPDC056132 TaxID=3345722 RepID=UPI0035E27750
MVDRCDAPLSVPPNLIDTAVSLTGRDPTEGEAPLFVHCELDEHIEGDHAAHLRFTPGPSGRAAWVFWREYASRVQLMDPCTQRNTDGICLLFAEHPGGHLWPGTSNTRTAQRG